jgi:hypothetical protein
MTDRPGLEAALESLARDVAFPATPNLRPRVLDRLAERSARSWWPSRSLPRAAVLAAALALALAAVAAATVLLLPGLRLTLVPELPTSGVPSDGLAARLALGERTDVTDERVAPGVPAALGTPDEAYVDAETGVVSLVYLASDDLVELQAGSGIGLLVQSVEGRLDQARVEKLVEEVHARITAVEVSGSRGTWISGPPHLVRYFAPDGSSRSESTRLAGDTLVWQRDGRLYRLESRLGLERTLEIAESIAP